LKLYPSFLCIVLFAGLSLAVSASARAEQSFVLKKIDKEDEVNVTRFVLEFNKTPEFQVRTSGQKLEVDLQKTVAGSDMVFPPEDERLVRVLLGQGKDRLMVSMLLRRPPYFVNTSKDPRTERITVDVHWRDAQSGMRPAIARSLPGQVSQRDGIVRRGIDSKYRGDWLQFFEEYELPVVIPTTVHYTMPLFPALSLLGPVEDVLPVEVEELAQAEDWDAAVNALRNIGFESTTGTARVRFLLMVAELELRGEHYSTALRTMENIRDLLPEDDEALRSYHRLLQMYIDASALSDPYQLMAALELDVQRDDNALLLPYSELLHAEVALATGHIKQVKIVLEEQVRRDVGSLGVSYQQRMADVLFEQGNYTAAIERYEGLSEQLVGFPHSLAGFAMSLYRSGDYDGALVQLKRFLDNVDEPEPRDMARYLMAMALIHRGDKDAGYDLLHQIIPGTQGALLAKAKVADLSMLVDDFYSRRRACSDYGQLIDQMVDRDRRAEMQFKKALGAYILGQRMESVEEIRFLLKSDRLTNLAGDAQALLADILPDLIRGMIEEKKYFNALVLVEQNRELLVASQRNFDFLIGLGEVFSELEFSDRAVRLYLYLLDHASDEQETSQVYIPLLRALMQQEDYRRVLTYSERFIQQYPQAEQGAEVLLLRLKAMLALGREDEVFAALLKRDRPHTEDLDHLLAHLAWQRGDMPRVIASLSPLIGDDLEQEKPDDLIVLAEALMATGKNARALKLYRYLQGKEPYRDQALYRDAQLSLQQGQRAVGLKLLRQLVEEATDSQWRSLAEETLAIERFNR
jgi:outer membrane protein assembly factor BamD (BamD/ComL family)